MKQIFEGRWSAEIEGDFVLFLIGMRANRPWRLGRTLRVAAAMPPIVRDLERNPGKGCLGTRIALLSPISPILIQAWRDFESLERYARDEMLHTEPWKRFYQRVGNGGDVGIWHETLKVRAGEYEAIYVNMPRFGLAAAGDHAPLSSRSRARTRISGRSGAEDRAGTAPEPEHAPA